MFRSVLRRSGRSSALTKAFNASKPSLAFVQSANAKFVPKTPEFLNFPESPYEKEPLPPSWTEKFKLNEPTRWVPLGVITMAILTKTGIYHWDEETQILAVFTAFFTLVYTQGGPMIKEYLDQERMNLKNEYTEIEEKNIAKLREEISHFEKFRDFDKNVETLVAERKKLDDELREAVPISFEQRKNLFFKKKLDRIVAIEAEAKASLQSTLVGKATEEVTKAYQTDQALQDKSLKSALEWLKAPEGQKKNLTEVGDEFKKFFDKSKKDSSVTKSIEDNMQENIQKVLAEKFEPVDEFKYLKEAN